MAGIAQGATFVEMDTTTLRQLEERGIVKIQHADGRPVVIQLYDLEEGENGEAVEPEERAETSGFQ